MRATGIVRRIDDLGRVVIPKEIRRTLRIREGDPLEIYTDRDGEVILKKYSPIGEMSSFAKDYTESLFRSLGHVAVIVDRDQVVAASGVPRKELWDKPISRDLESAIAGRQTVALNRAGGARVITVTTEDDSAGHQPHYRRRRSNRRGAADEPREWRAHGRYGTEGRRDRSRHRRAADGAVIPRGLRPPVLIFRLVQCAKEAYNGS